MTIIIIRVQVRKKFFVSTNAKFYDSYSDSNLKCVPPATPTLTSQPWSIKEESPNNNNFGSDSIPTPTPPNLKKSLRLKQATLTTLSPQLWSQGSPYLVSRSVSGSPSLMFNN